MVKHGRGVSTDELVNFMDLMTDRMAERVRGIGAKQYAKAGSQKFEDYPIDFLVTEMLDEIIDCLAYTNMLAIKLLAATRGK